MKSPLWCIWPLDLEQIITPGPQRGKRRYCTKFQVLIWCECRSRGRPCKQQDTFKASGFFQLVDLMKQKSGKRGKHPDSANVRNFINQFVSGGNIQILHTGSFLSVHGRQTEISYSDAPGPPPHPSLIQARLPSGVWQKPGFHPLNTPKTALLIKNPS